jgi:hypothetical protein
MGNTGLYLDQDCPEHPGIITGFRITEESTAPETYFEWI